MTLHIKTPLIESRPLSVISGRSIWLKLEALQPSGSFKLRGIGHACETYLAQGARRFVSSSGGNAGLAVAYAGRLLRVPVTVVVPETTTARAKELLRLENAEVVVHGASWQEANDFALSLIGPQDAFLHPFDDPLLWQGHATLVDEVACSGVRPDAIVLSVGGGGLLSGVVAGLHRNGWGNIPVIAVETAGAESFHEATKAGHAVELERISSIATSLGARRVCEKAVQWSKEHQVRSTVVSDRSALSACQRFLADHRLLVEPACGASLALVYEQSPELEGFGTILIVVCGGATATLDQIREWAKTIMKKILYMLIGPKGAGKTSIGMLVDQNTDIKFIRVESIWLGLAPGENGWEKVEETIDRAFLTHDKVMIESLGVGEEFRQFHASLAANYSTRMIRVVADLDTCLARVRSRNNADHIGVSDDQVKEYNKIAARATYAWDLEVSNNTPGLPDGIIQAILAI